MTTLLALALAIAAPVPKAAGKKMEEVYGEIINKDGKDTIEMSGAGDLSITSPPQTGRGVMGVFRVTPLVAKKVEGDFVVTYRAKRVQPDPAKTASVNANEVADTLVGIGVAPKPGLFGLVIGVRSTIAANKNWESSGLVHSSIPGRGEANTWEVKDKPNAPQWVRLTRRGNMFTTEYSVDGDKWKTVREAEIPTFAGPLLVGPVVSQNTNQEVSAEFTHYELKELPAEKK